MQACNRCRLKKYRCNELYPCLHCKRHNVQCQYGRDSPRVHEDDRHVPQLLRQIRELEDKLAERGGSASGQSPESTLPNVPGSRLGSPDDSEITDVNQHTNGIEFHGSTSSVAFLGNLELRFQRNVSQIPPEDSASLVSRLHNSAFPPPVQQRYASGADELGRDFYFSRAHVFIDAYFSGIHFIHPIIEKEQFMARAARLWMGSSGAASLPSTSFMALYFALLSLGALTRSWEEGPLDGLTRFQWSRKLFSEAVACLNEQCFSSELDTVHCLYLMAKVCQNELNPHLAYMYLGQAIRTCLSAGFNREVSNPKAPWSGQAMSLTWWGLFSLEIEMSFALGRPDTLGMDQYHNRTLPKLDNSASDIIPCMVQFSHVIRRVSVGIYHSTASIKEKLSAALLVDKDIDAWFLGLPPHLRPDEGKDQPFTPLKTPKWCQRQRLVLEIRYQNVKMLLFRPFLSFLMRDSVESDDPILIEAADKCIQSAQRTIEVMYDVFKVHTYFRTWWYNTTYTMTAVSVLLLYIIRRNNNAALSSVKYIRMAIQILDAMEESLVARKCTYLVNRYLVEITRRDGSNGSAAAEDIPGIEFLDYGFEEIANLFEEMNGRGPPGIVD
ncbi:hypothetical protein GQ53DRAFT_850945 [Thozetella sp. PMI_491]|nr:hypothetical protein GQ53DRAFT_850945 [Thozetella sp. PMI_491]